MIQLTCVNCRKQLEVDDAFAGSVCRCQHCGTIQTVPKPGQRPRAPGPAVKAGTPAAEEPRALYQVKSRAGMSSHPSGLEELAEVVHSSGLSGSGMLNRSSQSLNYRPTEKKSNVRLIALLASIGLVLLIGVLVVFFIRGNASSAPPTPPVVNATPVVVGPPAFAGIALSGDKIIYVIDRGDATAQYFPAIKALLRQSVRSLGPERKFAVTLWNNGADDSYPHSGSAYATADEAGKLANWLDNISTGSATTFNSALNNAAYQAPKEIILLTGKADQIDGVELSEAVTKARGGKSIKIHGISIGTTADPDPMQKLASDNGGKYLHLTAAELTNISEP